jgi:small subunit ribosomal protein S16
MRMGKTKQPTYRLVAADSRSPRDGRFIEILGVYAPRGRSTADPSAVIDIDNDKVLRWLKQGAQPTDRVERLLKTSGAWDTFRGVAPTAVAPSASDTAAVSATEGAK